MRVLISGGAGFIGSHLAQALLDLGHDVRVLDNLSSGKRENLPQHPHLELIEGDVRDVPTVERAAQNIDIIFHLAAVASVAASTADPLGTHGSNFLGTLNLLEASRRHGVRRFLYASSAAVYGDTAVLPVSEDIAPRPLSPYAADKLAGEHYLGFYGRGFGLRWTAFRFFNIYGPRQDPSSPYSGVISIFTERIRQSQPVTIFGDGMQTRDFVYVSDLVEVLVLAMANARAEEQVLNVGRGEECTLLEMLGDFERLSGRRVQRHHEPSRVGDIRRSRADVTRLRDLLGYVPQTDLRTGLARLWNHLSIE
jgi:UDP-glucose 4-epimerase